jgi:hypothetical protein
MSRRRGRPGGAGRRRRASASYTPANHTVVLTLRGKMPKQGMQLTINTDLVRDAAGQPLDGNHDGQPGGNFIATLNSSGVIGMARTKMEIPASPVNAAAIDAVMADASFRIIWREDGYRRRAR